MEKLQQWQRVKEVVASAMELPPAEPHSCLDHACQLFPFGGKRTLSVSCAEEDCSGAEGEMAEEDDLSERSLMGESAEGASCPFRNGSRFAVNM